MPDIPNPNGFKLRIKPIRPGTTEELTDIPTFVAMFNPSDYTLTYRNRRRPQRPRRPDARATEFDGQETDSFTVRLLLDGTGAAEAESRAGQTGTVQERIQNFLKTCYVINGNLHQPNHLHLQWGIIDFYGWLNSVQIHYTLLDASGAPLRAELQAEFEGRDNATPYTRLSSPDLTHFRIAKAGDTLPLLAKEIYGSSRYYLFLAKANDLDDFRNLMPGTRINCPPLTTA